MGYRFGSTSRRRLEGVHPDLVKILDFAIARSKVDFSIVSGVRTQEEQQELYKKGRMKHPENGEWVVVDKRQIVTYTDGIHKKSNHQPKNDGYGHAIDFMVYHPNRQTRSKIAWDKEHLAYVAGEIKLAAAVLLERKEITHDVKWGANWDDDGVIKFDHRFTDRPHIELKVL